ncbi:MAG TPA: TIGR01906 family membrane protein [Dehalococcoidia bacterium]|jgi:integral membrane protein (TIGR01906 family)|nr:TIGR01906 family membrane protein [Dehalococcoidia bacterium]
MFSVIQKILFNAALFLAILLSNALIIINTDSFYEFEFNKNNTSLKTGINHSDLFIVVDNIQDFFNEKSNEKIQMTTYINGIEKNLFNSKEIRHMIDVKNLILNIKFFNYLLWTTVIVILLIKISLSKDKILNTFRVIAKSYFIYSVSILISALILLALSFRWIFYFFHIISFNNNLWILDPRTDYLIKIFEEVFFMDAAILIGILTLSYSIIIFLSLNSISKIYIKD